MNIFILSLTGLLLGIIATLIFEFILKKNKKLREKYYKHHKILFGYHVHHSTYGLFSIILSIADILQNENPLAFLLFAFGVGVIVQHTISDGRFVFIEKQKK